MHDFAVMISQKIQSAQLRYRRVAFDSEQIFSVIISYRDHSESPAQGQERRQSIPWGPITTIVDLEYKQLKRIKECRSLCSSVKGSNTV